MEELAVLPLAPAELEVRAQIVMLAEGEEGRLGLVRGLATRLGGGLLAVTTAATAATAAVAVALVRGAGSAAAGRS